MYFLPLSLIKHHFFEDINECHQLNEYKCEQEEICVNTLGSYYCKCAYGDDDDDQDEFTNNKNNCVGKNIVFYCL